MTPTIAADDVVKHYGDTTALDGVSLAVESGEVLAVIGPNGAGKTTLVRCLTGTTQPSDGDVTVLGGSPAATDRERLGVLPQDFRPPERLTARELVRYYGGFYDGHRDPDAVLDAVGLEVGAREQRFRTLSGGQQRRTCVAATLVNDPDALFLDEPTTGIDPSGRRALWRVVRDRAAAGAAVMLTTHDMEEAAELADRVAMIADGEIVATGEPAELVARHGGEPALLVESTAAATAVRDDVDGEPTPTVEDGVLRFDGVRSTEIQGVLDRLAAAGIGYDAVTWRQPTLDDVFLALADVDDRDAMATTAADTTTVGGGTDA